MSPERVPNVKDVVREVMLAVYLDLPDAGEPPEFRDDLRLLDSGLDSLGFAVVVTELEDRLGFDPFSESSEPYYPETVGDLVSFYERRGEPR